MAQRTMTGYFWFSAKQLHCLQGPRPDRQSYRPIYCRLDGAVREYTNWTKTESHGTKWDDMVLLGYGTYVGTDAERAATRTTET